MPDPKLSIDKPSFREMTIPAIVLGTVLSIVMGAANVYLGLRAGITVSASIPAAVVAMAILHGIMRRKSILESNLVQTAASAGESLAAGIIFTMPALILTGIWTDFNYWITTGIAMAGGLLGVLFMIPMRRVFVLNSPELKYPEGVACAAVLRAGEGEDESNAGAISVFLGLTIGALFKFVGSYLGVFKHVVEWGIFAGSRVFYFGMDVSPALVSVGVIVGLAISAQVFLGGAIGWLIMIPMLSNESTSGIALDDAWTLWSTQVRYTGVGAMVVGGVVSLIKVRKGLYAATAELFQKFNTSSASENSREETDLSSVWIAVWTLITIIMIFVIYKEMLPGSFEIVPLITFIMIIMSFFFTAVASYIVGLVGNSNSPVSGMTITTVLFTGAIIHLMGWTGEAAIVATLGVAGVVCCVCCTSGDVCNDLKTGHMVGATPRNQQILQIIGVIAAAFVLAPVLMVLHHGSINNGTGGIGGSELSAPQATLFAALTNGFFGDGTLPWNMVKIGVAIGLGIQIVDIILAQAGSTFRLYIMPVAIGIYLPFGLSSSMLVGGIIHYLISRSSKESVEMKHKTGLLTASGLIAGESLMGVVIGILAFCNFTSLHLGDAMNPLVFDIVSVGILALISVWIFLRAIRTNPV